MTLKNTWVTGETYAASDQNAIATAVNANTSAQPQFGLLSSRPAAGHAGLVYYCTDCDAVFEDTGSAWVRVGFGDSGINSLAGDVPTSSWTAVNVPGGGSWAQSLDGMLLTMPSGAGGFAFEYRTYPSPPFTLTTYMDYAYLAGTNFAIPTNGTNWYAGIVTSDGTKYISVGPGGVQLTPAAPWGNGSGVYVAGMKHANATTFSSAYNANNTPVIYIGKIPKWYSYTDDGTNITWKYSLNGIEWVTLAAEARTTFLTPSRIGVGAFNNGGASLLLRVRSWSGVS